MRNRIIIASLAALIITTSIPNVAAFADEIANTPVIAGESVLTEDTEIIAEGSCGDTVTWKLTKDGVMTISGSGKMWDFRNDADFFDYHENPYADNRSLIKKVVFEEGITYVGADAFTYCDNLTSVTFSDSITSIGCFSFFDCGNLCDVTLPVNLQSLGQEAFAHCDLTSVEIPDNITFLDAGVFGYNKRLSYVYIGGNASVPSFVIGNCFFRCCPSLEEIIVSENNIGLQSHEGVLYSGTVLMQYPSGKKDTSYTVKPGTTDIMQLAFEENDYLESIFLPKSILSIRYSFGGYDNLTNIYYEGTEEDWNKIYTETVDFNPLFMNSTIYYNSVSPEQTEEIKSFTNRLYDIYLDRDAEIEGLSNWVNDLQSGKKTSADIVYGISASQEFVNKDLSNEEVIDKMYQAMLGRSSDPEGKENWVRQLDAGMSFTAIINGFSGSQEFADICSDYGILPGSISNIENRDKNAGLTAFVSRMYTKALGREYDVNGLNDWTGSYLDETATTADIAYGFIFSKEFIEKELTDEQYIDVLYQTFFDRDADPEGRQNWLDALARGESREHVLNGFIESKEFLELAASFGV